MDSTQLLKGILEGIILKIISEKETYGYEIITELNKCGLKSINDGTLYPILMRLEKKKNVNYRKVKSEIGPIRKYYSITAKGKEELNNFLNSYQNIIKITNNILERKGV